MGNLLLKENGSKHETVTLTRSDGTTQKLNVIDVKTFDAIPENIRTRYIAAIKAEIKKQYDAGERSCIKFKTTDVRLNLAEGSNIYDAHVCKETHDTLIEFCNTLFGPFAFQTLCLHSFADNKRV